MTGDRLRWLGALGIVSIAVMRCCVVFTPQLVFDTDPAVDSSPIAALGMGGSLLLDVCLLVACCMAFLGEWRSGRGLDPLLLILGMLPLPIIAYHGLHDAGNAWRGGTWFAAAMACVAIAHLARERNMRIVIVAGLVAVVAPLLIRGAVQMTWEHDATVELFQNSKAAFLQARGWDPDSPAARIYERRLMHREPTGWFPSTNLYGSIMAAATVFFAGMAMVAFKAYRAGVLQSGMWFLMAALALLCAVAMKFTTSMGAALAMVAGAITLCLLLLAPGSRSAAMRSGASPTSGAVPRWLPSLALIMVAGATLGVIVRGALLPEGFLGEKSLLFRWHYLQAALGIVNESPLLGSGPSSFQLKYMLHRVPRNPEEVQSAHAMFSDWVATLGFLGGAWVALVIAMMARSGGPSNPQPEKPADDSRLMRTTLGFAIGASLLALLPAMAIERFALDAADVFLRGLSVLAYIALASIVAGILSILSDGMQRGIAAAAVVVLLVHGQIEMTYFQGGTVVWMMAMTGLIGFARPARSMIVNNLCATSASLILLGFAGWTLYAAALPALAQERTMLEAARMLDAVRAEPANVKLVLRQRPLAAERLVEAYDLWPINNQPINAAVEQLLLATELIARPGDVQSNGAPLGLMMRAEELADQAAIEHDSPSSIVLAMNVHAGLAALTDDPEQWSRAIALGRRMTEIDPRGVGQWKRLGDTLWAAGAKAEAAKAYHTALANSDNFALDELKQLSAASRAILQQRIDAAAHDKELAH